MLPDPLHPAVVHFPIVLVVILPIFALGALWAIRRGTMPLRAWALPTLLAGALALSALVALRTGQTEEDRVEKVVSERVIEAHEEAADRFLALSAVLFVVTGVGLMRGSVGRAARIVATVGAVALIGAGYQVGRAGGELVYQHGAASAYAGATIANGGEGVAAVGENGRRTDDDD